METTLKTACANHALSAIGANMFNASTGEITVYIHWGEADCCSGSGKTFDEALACAVAEMAERRAHEAAA